MKMTEQAVADNNMTGATDAPSGSGIARAMLEEFERELTTTRRFLERLPADRFA
ncbi:MAG TPA: hypothetical protein VG826_24395 [Pirellulales bacterium]|nr:hypothetical protein [Pirellulales bacterium]